MTPPPVPEKMTDLHPNVHKPWTQWSNTEKLYVAVAYSNPFRWRSRRELFNDFRSQMRCSPNVVLYVGELAYGDRPHEVTSPDNPLDLQLRTKSELFHKENILNLVIQEFPETAKYGCIIDGDFTFTRADWALETIHQLQHYDWVQPFSSYAVLSPKTPGGCRSMGIRKSFVATYYDNGKRVIVPCKGYGQDYVYGSAGATGGAWAFRMAAFETVGGLLDVTILGHGDWFMAFALAMEKAPFMQLGRYHPHYVAFIDAWRQKAEAFKANIGVVDGFAVHHYHGSYKNRGYETRDEILVKYQFDPIYDLARNYQGVYELAGNKPAFRDAVRQYFISRMEDSHG